LMPRVCKVPYLVGDGPAQKMEQPISLES